jgi:chloramphenicol 3-O phosphotransferase
MTRIVVLNGVGSVGKSSLARALQTCARLPLLHVAMDGFLEMLPEALQDSPEGISYQRTERGVEVKVGPVGARLLDGMLGAVAALAEAGCDLIFDTVMEREAALACRRRLAAFDTVVVGLIAPLSVIEAREAARGDREIGLARAQFARVHVGVDDDLTLDMGELSPGAAAQVLCAKFGL